MTVCKGLCCSSFEGTSGLEIYPSSILMCIIIVGNFNNIVFCILFILPGLMFSGSIDYVHVCFNDSIQVKELSELIK